MNKHLETYKYQHAARIDHEHYILCLVSKNGRYVYLLLWLDEFIELIVFVDVFLNNNFKKKRIIIPFIAPRYNSDNFTLYEVEGVVKPVITNNNLIEIAFKVKENYEIVCGFEACDLWHLFDSLKALIGPKVESKDNGNIKRAGVEIYVKDKISLEMAENIENVCGDFMQALGFKCKSEDKPVFQSFWKRLGFVFKRNVTEQDIDRLFAKGKQALELRHVDLPTAEQTEKLACAAEKMAQILEKVQNGSIRLGSILVLKTTTNGIPHITIQQLPSDIVYLFNNNPGLIKNLEAVKKIISLLEYNEEIEKIEYKTMNDIGKLDS